MVAVDAIRDALQNTTVCKKKPEVSTRVPPGEAVYLSIRFLRLRNCLC